MGIAYQLSFRVLTTLTALSALTASGTEIAVDAAKSLNVSKADDDVAQLKRLALHVGSDFAPNRVTDAYLKRLQIQTIRLINVGISGRFDGQGNFVEIKPSSRLADGLALCKRLSANPHVIIHGLPEQLLKSVPLKVTRNRALGIDLVNKRQAIGPTDYRLLENWYFAYFEYVTMERGFTDAVFEIFNEPDLGMLIYPTDDIPAKGSDASYDCMLKIYRAASAAAVRFEANHPDCKVTLGGPAITLAFTYRYSNKGWAKRFVVDCAREKLKLDFLGLHHYASVAPFRGAARAGLTNYPPLPEMLAAVQAVIDENLPGLPLRLTEYGAHHNVVGAVGEINASHDGAAFSLDCLDAMLELGIDSASYLVTADQQRHDPETQEPYNVYSWCSFLTASDFFGYPYPKAPYHAYKMVSELTGKRVAATVSAGNTRVFAAADPASQKLRVLLWNFATYIPEYDPVLEEGRPETVTLTIANAALPAETKAVLRMVDKVHGDVYSAARAKRPVNLAAATPRTVTLPLQRNGGQLEFEIVMQPGSIAMLELGENPTRTSLQTPYVEQAEILLKVMRDNRDEQPKTTLQAGATLLQLDELHSEQKMDALTLLVVAAGKAQQPGMAETFAQNSETLCKNLNKPLPFAVARRLGDAERAQEQYAAAVKRYRQAVIAPDCDWRLRFGTELALIECLNVERRFKDVIEFCDSVIGRQEEVEHVAVLKGDFRVCQIEAWRNLGQTEPMFAVYKELLNSNASDSAKLGGVIVVVAFHQSQNAWDKALTAGQTGLALANPHPGLLGKLKTILKQVETAKANDHK